MGVPNRQIGVPSSIKDKLLHDISKQLDRLIGVISTSTGGGGGSYTFSNGLTETAGVVKLGGTLSEAVSIGGPSILGFGDLSPLSEIRLLSGFANKSTSIQLTGVSGNTSIISVDNNTFEETDISISPTSLQLFSNQLIIAGNSAFIGAEYDTDYSANYTNRSLTDKEYVDTAVSDRRLKSNIIYIGSALNKINQLKPATFNMIKDNEFKAGFIAQELEEVFPEMIVEGEYLKIKKDQLLPYLVKAIQELSAEIELLKNK